MNKGNFVVDNSGNRIAVMLSIKEYNKMREAMEELEDIKAYDATKLKQEPTIPLREVIELRKKKRKND